MASGTEAEDIVQFIYSMIFMMSLLHSTLGLAVAVEVPRGQGRNKVNGIHWSSDGIGAQLAQKVFRSFWIS